jgi:RNA polymerase sigma factor (sigma-70 family)
MTKQDEDFIELIRGIREGSDVAFQQLVTVYGDHILRVVRRKLVPAMRSRFDSADFVQSVWAVFIKHRERLADCRNADELINFLAKVASDRVIDERRRQLTLKRQNVNREVPLAQLTAASSPTHPGPTASQVAVANECLSRLAHEQETQIRLMVLMKLEGATHAEIANALGTKAKTVQRALRRLERQVPR